ncbi:hypothetical protein BDV12DRAFT_163919 [Aspergillus spectabilis]
MISPIEEPPTLTETNKIDYFIQTNPLTISLRQNPNFTESRPHTEIASALQSHNLMTGPLAGPHKISTPPYVFTEINGNRMAMILHLGSDICGHPGIIHGGLLATLFDEALARCCFAALPNKIGVTANLNIDYRAPAVADAWFVLWAEIVRVEGRKVWGKGVLERLAGDGDGEEEERLVAEAKALFVEPRDVTGLKSIYKAV